MDLNTQDVVPFAVLDEVDGRFQGPVAVVSAGDGHEGDDEGEGELHF